MCSYNHFEYGEHLAIKLKPISHTPEKPRFFEAFGLEDLFNLNDKLSSVTGTILIAVNGYESDSKDNGADGLNDTLQYNLYRCPQHSGRSPENHHQRFRRVPCYLQTDTKLPLTGRNNRPYHRP